ncbi:uncharacterized protein EV420DRAFT_1552809 [Desarmillaria tabescens]|uniref:MYND-type domain-containing protein n=1 Tax=Armillaria tabescens TaxID=1929756 RepID=A0AA39N367_ARMTA|nr:uncharacterized protein EV420DRAFT_1552809 [Desarmillaria tabescens]KAK0455704.1 hypothetical protein EV420DRAFT_1552809 [Desarmillaria tabescens]
MQNTQMPGSPTRYALDLDDVIAFPDIAHVPVLPPQEKESWYILTEIVSNESVFRPVFRVEDKLSGNYWVVAFYTDNPVADAKDCEVGHMICIKNGMPKQFADGQHGYRIEDPSNIVILPCGLAKLRQLNAELHKRSDDGLLSSCVVCNSRVRKGCGKCKTRYCSKECQKANWPRHKPICKVLKTLHEWNRTDWG